MNSPKLNNAILGWCLGIVGPSVGFVIVSLLWSTYYRKNLSYLWQDIILRFSELHAPVLTLSLVFNLLTFLLFSKYGHLKTSRGILGATFLYIPVVVYLKFGG